MSRRFGRYLIRDELTDELGRGAFGRVYRAFDPNINRYVAIKILFSGSDPDMLVRFQDESKTAGQLEHENIVKIYDFDLQEGMPYLVMELLDGETLETIIKTQKIAGLPIQLLDKVEIMFQVAKGLQYAHSENVVHRDIKPGNIMVLPNGTVKVMDFGIARVMDKDGTRRTRQGDIAGTILYMAPEQFSGRDADKRTDIFAYADVYYELLTGEHPFFASDFATVMYRITAHEPRPIRERLPDCPAALENMIQRLLVKDPELRPDRLDEVVLKTQPILQRLRRERAAVMAAEIEPLIKAGDLDRAQTAIRHVLQLDPLNLLAETWREQIQQEQELETMRARAETLVRKGHEDLLARRFKEALQSFESALKLNRTNPEIKTLVDQVQNTIDNVRIAARLVAEARTEMERGQLEHAVDKAARAVELDPGNPEAPPLRDRLRQEIRSRRETALLARAESLCKMEDFDGAAAVLSEAEAVGFSTPKITACRTRVELERVEAEKRRRQAIFVAALAKAREALYGQRLQEASDSAEALCAEYPEERAASELLSEVREYLAAQRRLEAINRATQTARGLMKAKRLDDAREVLEAGLRAFPRDTGISRLMEIVNTLTVAQERARKIGQVVRQAHSLADEGQLDEALRAVMDAIAEFGEEPSLLECKRNFQLERDQREYARGLQAKLDQGRRLLTEGNPAKAVGLLDDAMLQYPGEPEIALLLSSARGALAAFRESEFVKQHRSQIASLEAAGQYGAALALIQAALARYPGNAELLDTAGRLRQAIKEQERQRLFAAHVHRVEAAIQSADWESAATNCEAAQLDFPEEAVLAGYSASIQNARRQQAIQQLQAQVRASLGRQDLEAAERQLSAAQPNLSQDPAWQALRLELERYRAYDGDLRSAAEAGAAGAYDRALELLRTWLEEKLEEAPDPRAAKLFEAVSRERQEAEERARREAQEAAIAKGRGDAQALVRKNDYQGAIALLDRLAAQYPGSPEIRQDRETAAQALARSEAEASIRKGDYQTAIASLDQLAAQYPGNAEIQRDREAAAQALAQALAEAALAKERSEAEALIRKGDYQTAITTLDQLAKQYPDNPEIQQDREAAAQALNRQRREAEEQARRTKEAAIDKGRSDADVLIRKGDYQAAITSLDQLAAQYPGNPEIQQDREAAAQALAQALDRQRREAEEQARRRQEEAAATADRQKAAELVKKADYEGAIVILRRLAQADPGDPAIQQELETADRELQRLRAEATISQQRREAAALAEKGDYQAAIAILHRLAQENPGNRAIQEHLDSVKLGAERQRQAAEEQTRSQHIVEVVAQGRRVAAALCAQGAYADAVSLLEQLARDYGGSPEIEQDRQTAATQLARQREESAIAKARQDAAALEEAAVAKGRQDAAALIAQGDCRGALASLDQLASRFPLHSEILRDRETAQRELDRQLLEAEEQSRRQSEADAIAKARADAAAMVKNGDYQAALAMLDWFAGQFPEHLDIQRDRDAVARQLEIKRREAEEQDRRQQELLAIANARREGDELVRRGEYPEAIALFDRLAGLYPRDPEIRAGRDAAAAALEQQRRETEERAKRALSTFSARQRDTAGARVSATGAAPGQEAANAADPAGPPPGDAEERAKLALAALSARKQAAPDKEHSPATPNPAGAAGRLAGIAAKGRHLLDKLNPGKR